MEERAIRVRKKKKESHSEDISSTESPKYSKVQAPKGKELELNKIQLEFPDLLNYLKKKKKKKGNLHFCVNWNK